MDLYDWLLFLHVLAAFVTVLAVVVYAALLVAAGRGAAGEVGIDPVLRLYRLGDLSWSIGGGLVLLLGIFLAIDVDGYSPWDGWIIAAYVLWAVAGASGVRVAAVYREALAAGGPAAAAGVRSGRSLAMHGVMFAALLLLLVDMIYKPGA